MAIDTLVISGKLRAAGFTEAQAVAQVEALQEATEDLVTKRDLQRAIKGLESRMESRMETQLAQLETRILRYILFSMVGLTTVQTAIFAVIVKFL